LALLLPCMADKTMVLVDVDKNTLAHSCAGGGKFGNDGDFGSGNGVNRPQRTESTTVASATRTEPASPAKDMSASDRFRNLAVLDAGTPWPDLLAAGADRDVAVHLPGTRAIDPVLEALAGAGRPVRTLHLVSHGQPGFLSISGKILDGEALSTMGRSWAPYLAPEATIVLYGCSAGQGILGRKLVEALSRATGARIIASSTPIGSATRGGDWRFDVSSDGIAPEAAAVSAFGAVHATWPGLLAAVVTNTNGDVSAGSIRAAAATNDNIYEFSNLGSSATINLAGPLNFNVGSATSWRYTGNTTSVTIGGDDITADSHLYFQLASAGNSLTINSPIIFTGLSDIALVQGGTVTFNGDISDVGRLMISSSGTAVLGTTTSAALIDIAGNSTLRLGTDAAYTSNIEIENTATIDTGTHNVTFSGNVTDDGANALVKTGTGTLTLSGVNTYSGTTTVNAGTLSIASDGNLGGGALTLNGGTLAVTDVTTINNAITLGASNGTLNTTADTTFSGIISGAGNLTKTGANTATLTGTNTYSGTTTIDAGTLSVSADNNLGTGAITLSGGNLAVTGTTTIDNAVALSSNAIVTNSANVTLSGVISGANNLTKAGAGTLTLSGTDTYSGATTINAGTLSVNGSITNSTSTVNGGGTLAGTGTVGSVLVNGGNFAPGNSIGTINVAGNVDFSGNGNYNVEVDAAGNSDKIIATGTATLTSGIVNVQPEAGNYSVSTDYTILTAAGGLGGTTFSSVNSNLAFLTPSLSYDANNVFLNLTRNNVSFSGVTSTPNQSAVATILGNNASALQDLTDNILTLTSAGARQAFESLSGVQHAGAQNAMARQNSQFTNVLANRFGGGTQSSTVAINPLAGPLLAYNGDDWPAMMANALAGLPLDGDTGLAPGRGWWIQGYGQFGNIDDTDNAPGSDYRVFGTALGIDRKFCPGLVVGAALGIGSSDVDGLGYDADVTSYQLATYAGWQQEAYYLHGTLSAGYHDTDATRQIVVGATTSTAESEYDAISIGTSIESGKQFTLNKTTTLTPFVGIEYSHLHQGSFTENDAGSANLAIASQNENSLRTRLGAGISHSLETAQGWQLRPSARIAYVHELLDNVSRVDAGFTGVAGATFAVDGPQLDRDRMVVNIGLMAALSEGTQLDFGYDAEIAGSDDHHVLSVTFHSSW